MTGGTARPFPARVALETLWAGLSGQAGGARGAGRTRAASSAARTDCEEGAQRVWC